MYLSEMSAQGLAIHTLTLDLVTIYTDLNLIRSFHGVERRRFRRIGLASHSK